MACTLALIALIALIATGAINLELLETSSWASIFGEALANVTLDQNPPQLNLRIHDIARDHDYNQLLGFPGTILESSTRFGSSFASSSRPTIFPPISLTLPPLSSPPLPTSTAAAVASDPALACPSDRASPAFPICEHNDCLGHLVPQQLRCTTGPLVGCDCKHWECPDLAQHNFYCSECGGRGENGKCRGQADENFLFRDCECRDEPDWEKDPPPLRRGGEEARRRRKAERSAAKAERAGLDVSEPT